MDIQTRIRRRQHRSRESRLIEDYATLSPVCHVAEPTGRGRLVEELLDHLDPVFDGELPPNAHVYGPAGSGKSAVVTTLFQHLDDLLTETESAIRTSTRAQAVVSPEFVTLDARLSTSEFEFYRRLVDALVEDSIPTDGIGTDALKSRLRTFMGKPHKVVVAVDHVGEPGSIDGETLLERFEGIPGRTSFLTVGRGEPAETGLGGVVEASIPVEPYQHRTLVDVLMTRASSGFSRGTPFEHDTARRIADWADGDAHDALTVLFVAAVRAEEAGRMELTEDDIVAAAEEVPEPCVSLGRVLSLPANKQRVLREFVRLDEADRASVTDTTAAISAAEGVDLSSGTIKRLLYEMAEDEIVDLETAERRNKRGRPPSRVVPRFPPVAYRHLYDLRKASAIDPWRLVE